MMRRVPQDIAYLIDLGLLNKSPDHGRTHRCSPQGAASGKKAENPPENLSKVARNKNPSKKTIRKGVKSQLQYLRRNFKMAERMLDGFGVFPLDHKLQRKYWIIQTVYLQRLKMFESRSQPGRRPDCQYP